MTLTFKELVSDYDLANNLFKKFIKRLNYQTKQKNKYLAIREFQTSGRLHYHLVLFNSLPFLTNDRYQNNAKLAQIWQKGFCDIKKINDVTFPEKIACYLSKYLTKSELAKEQIKVNKKLYFTSQGLQKITKKKLALNNLEAITKKAKISFSQAYYANTEVYILKKGAFNGE